MKDKEKLNFIPLNIAVLTISGYRDNSNDSAGDFFLEALQAAGHKPVEKIICKPDRYRLRAQLSHWIADPRTQVILISGGTGFNADDCLPEALTPLLDKQIEGFGELFRQLSYQEIGSAALQSRALAGLANQTLIFAMPGSPNACKLAWYALVRPQLDRRQGPCNFVPHLGQAHVCEAGR